MRDADANKSPRESDAKRVSRARAKNATSITAATAIIIPKKIADQEKE
jgi:hypothetical protein